MWCICWHRGGLGSSPDGETTLWATHGETSLLLNYKDPGSLQDCKLSSTGGLWQWRRNIASSSLGIESGTWMIPSSHRHEAMGTVDPKGQQSQTRPQADTTRCRKSSGHSGGWSSPWCIKVRRQTSQRAGQAIRPTKQVLCSAPQELSPAEVKSQDHMNCRHHFWGWGFQTFPWLQRLIFIVSAFSPSFNSLHFSPCPKWSPKLFSFEGPESSTPITLEGFSALPCPVSVAASTAGHSLLKTTHPCSFHTPFFPDSPIFLFPHLCPGFLFQLPLWHSRGTIFHPYRVLHPNLTISSAVTG